MAACNGAICRHVDARNVETGTPYTAQVVGEEDANAWVDLVSAPLVSTLLYMQAQMLNWYLLNYGSRKTNKIVLCQQNTLAADSESLTYCSDQVSKDHPRRPFCLLNHLQHSPAQHSPAQRSKWLLQVHSIGSCCIPLDASQ